MQGKLHSKKGRGKTMRRFRQGLKSILPMLLAVFLSFSLTTGSCYSLAEEMDKNDSVDETTQQIEDSPSVEPNDQTDELLPQESDQSGDEIVDDKPSSEVETEEPSTPQDSSQVEEDMVVEEANRYSLLNLESRIDDRAPEHHKSIHYNEDGSYTLTLDVTGKVDKTVKIPKANVLLIIDKSGSMNDNDRMVHLREVITGNNGLIDTIFRKDQNGKSEIDAQMAVVTYSGSQPYFPGFPPFIPPMGEKDKPYNDGEIISKNGLNSTGWLNDPDGLKNVVKSIRPEGGTNSEAGLYHGKEALQNRNPGYEQAPTYMIFLSDGAPTFYYDEKGITQGAGSGYDEEAARRALAMAKTIQGLQGFYTVSCGDKSSESTQNRFLSDLKDAAGAKNKGFYKYADGEKDKLIEVFQNIASEITRYDATEVVISDTLSDNVQLVDEDLSKSGYQITITDKDGKPIPNMEEEIRQSGIQWQQNGKQLIFTFNPAYRLKQDLTYSVSFKVKPTEKAYTEFEKSGIYPNGGQGFYSNDGATLDYKFNGTSNSVNYDEKPVFKLPLKELTVQKEWSSLQKEESVNIAITENGKVDRTINLSGKNDWKQVVSVREYDANLKKIDYEVREKQEEKLVESNEFYEGDNGVYQVTYTEKNNVYTVTNTYKPSALIVKNEVQGIFGDTNAKFVIRIELRDSQNRLVEDFKDKKFKQTNQPGVYEAKLKHKEMYVLDHLKNYSYTVKEIESFNHEVSYQKNEEQPVKNKDGISGKLKCSEDTIIVINRKSGIIDTGIHDIPFKLLGSIIGVLSLSILSIIELKRRHR